jgi:transcriptional regulator with XRE-family HTH domain
MSRRFNPDAIRIIREARNLSREELATLLGRKASRQMVHAWETGEYNPSVESLSAIMNALGLKSVDIFFTNTDQHNNSQEATRVE